MGLAALERARAAGLSDAQIKTLAAQQGIQFADQAAKSLGVPSNTQIQSSGNPLLNFVQPGSTVMGLAAVDRARAAGYSDQQIKDLAARNGITFAEQARASLGVSGGTGITGGTAAPSPPPPAMNTTAINAAASGTSLSQYIGSSGSGNVMGLAALERARAAGLSDAQIKTLSAQQGIQFADQAAKSLGVPSNAQIQAAGNPLLNFMQPGSTVMGLSSVERARAAGYSDQQIKDLASKNGITFATKAAEALGTRGSSNAPALAAPSPSPVPGAQQSYAQALQASGPSEAERYQASFQNSLNNYSGNNNAQQEYQNAFNNMSAGSGADQTAQFQNNYQNFVSNSAPSTNQAEFDNYKNAYNNAIQGLSNPATSNAPSDYENYARDYQAALNNLNTSSTQPAAPDYQQSYTEALKAFNAANTTAANADNESYAQNYQNALGNYDYGVPKPSGPDYQQAYNQAIKDYSADLNQTGLSGYQSAYEAAAQKGVDNSATNQYQQTYNDLLKRATEDYDKEISRYQQDLTSSRTELNKALSDRDEAVERAKQWESRFNDDAKYEADEQLRGVRTGRTSVGSSTASSGDLASGRSAYSSSAEVSRSGARARPGVAVTSARRNPLEDANKPASAYTGTGYR
jgi:bacterioferritin-associated ferredoxin